MNSYLESNIQEKINETENEKKVETDKKIESVKKIENEKKKNSKNMVSPKNKKIKKKLFEDERLIPSERRHSHVDEKTGKIMKDEDYLANFSETDLADFQKLNPAVQTLIIEALKQERVHSPLQQPSITDSIGDTTAYDPDGSIDTLDIGRGHLYTAGESESLNRLTNRRTSTPNAPRPRTGPSLASLLQEAQSSGLFPEDDDDGVTDLLHDMLAGKVPATSTLRRSVPSTPRAAKDGKTPDTSAPTTGRVTGRRKSIDSKEGLQDSLELSKLLSSARSHVNKVDDEITDKFADDSPVSSKEASPVTTPTKEEVVVPISPEKEEEVEDPEPPKFIIPSIGIYICIYIYVYICRYRSIYICIHIYMYIYIYI
jgi:hypothetical protein